MVRIQVGEVFDDLKAKARIATKDIKEKIEAAFKRSAEVDARRIAVATRDGKVILTGRLATVRRPVVGSAPTKSVENRWYVGLVNENTSAATRGRASDGRITMAVRGRGHESFSNPHATPPRAATQNRHQSS